MNYFNNMEDDYEYVVARNKLYEIASIANNAKKLYFYGAGLRSEELLQIQKEKFELFNRPDAFIISDTKRESDHIRKLDGISIYSVDEVDLSEDDICVLVVAMDIYHNEIVETLKEKGCKNYLLLTDAMEHIITREFLKYYFEKNSLKAQFLPFIKEYQIDKEKYMNKLHTYSVMCEKDALLKRNINNAPWVSDLQAGACDAGHIIAEYRDDVGDNISKLNSYYNELTGLYWVWKNTDKEYTGICHYRRRFESDIVLEPILSGESDILLPLPFVVGNSLYSYYQHWGVKEYYDEMLNVVKDLYPDYYETATWCASHIVFIPNNICITNRTILDKYCSFLFGVIDEVEKRVSKKDIDKQKRCWLSEHVSTIFFIDCMKRYRVVFGNLIRYW